MKLNHKHKIINCSGVSRWRAALPMDGLAVTVCMSEGVLRIVITRSLSVAHQNDMRNRAKSVKLVAWYQVFDWKDMLNISKPKRRILLVRTILFSKNLVRLEIPELIFSSPQSQAVSQIQTVELQQQQSNTSRTKPITKPFSRGLIHSYYLLLVDNQQYLRYIRTNLVFLADKFSVVYISYYLWFKGT